jgi:hypothetical protein
MASPCEWRLSLTEMAPVVHETAPLVFVKWRLSLAKWRLLSSKDTVPRRGGARSF